MMTSALSLAVSKAATTDSVLTLTVVAMMAIRWRARRRSDAWSWPFCLLFYAILAASTLLKGPPGPMIVGTAWACEAAWRRRARQPILDRPAGRWLIEHAAGWALFLALTLPWCILAWRRTDGEFFRVAFGHHVVERSVQALEHHGGDSPLTTFLFLFYYLAVLPIEFFPWTAPFLAGLRHGWRERASEPTRFLWSWTLPMLVIFSIVRTKLPHYMAPLLPAWALMAGQWWTADGRGKRAVDAFGVDRSSIDQAVRRWGNAGAILTGVLGLAAGLALAGTGFYLGYRPLIAPGLLTGLVMGGGAVAGAWRWLRGDARRAMAAWWLSAVAWTLLIYLWLLPAFEPARPAKPLTDWVRAHVPAGVELMAADYREPSFVFYWQGPVAMLGNAEPEAALARLRDATRPVALLIPATRWGKWKRELPSLASDAIPVLYRRRFYLLTQGRWDDMLVVGNRKAAASAGG
jgi:4-amino-4-deoxy-L-arabinose transferase-like glycosyltransferase